MKFLYGCSTKQHQAIFAIYSKYIFEIYSGAEKKLQETILSILHPFVRLYHHIYMDNYYHNLDTAKQLLKEYENLWDNKIK